MSKRTIVLLAVLVVAVSVVAVLGGGWKWGDRKHATRIAGWAWGDDGSIVYDPTSPSTPPALPTQPAPQAQAAVENHG